MQPRIKIAIRCDSSEALGYGHVKRCMTISRAFIDANCEVKFICRKNSDSYFGAAQHPYDVLWIDNNFTNCTSKLEVNVIVKPFVAGTGRQTPPIQKSLLKF